MQIIFNVPVYVVPDRTMSGKADHFSLVRGLLSTDDTLHVVLPYCMSVFTSSCLPFSLDNDIDPMNVLL